MSRFLVYGLADPRTGVVRYIGKSSYGLERPKEHVHKAGRERTHKAAWVRSLKRIGLRPEIRVLEDVPDRSDLDIVEAFWIAQGKGLGWPLTNIAPGGRGGNALNRKQLPDAEIGRRYQAGESEQALAVAFGVNRWTIRHRLIALGVQCRDRGAAMVQRMAKMPPEERRRNVLAANDALRGQRYRRDASGRRIRSGRPCRVTGDTTR